MKNKAWCPLPWLSLNTRNNGDVRVCCNSNVSFNQGLVSKKDNTIYNLGKDDIDDYRNADLMKEIRKSMLNGVYHDSCIRCKREAESGMQSRADWERLKWNSYITESEARDLTYDDGSIDLSKNPIRFMDLRFGNLCNLKCRMCGPTDSNQWYNDIVKLQGPKYKDSGQEVKLVKNNKGKYEPIVDIYNWYENPLFWNDLEKYISNIRHLYIVGGEPLMIDQHYKFLQKCVDNGFAKKITIEYNTNITNIPERAWEIWKHFKKVQIGMSIDAVGPVNDYIRHPSKWHKIEQNMKKLDNAEGNFEIWWAATIQAYNLIHLPEMMLWKIEQKFKRINSTTKYKSIINPHPLHNPKFLNIKIFPKESKEWITEYFKEYRNTARSRIDDLSNYHHFCKILDTYTQYMWSEDYSDNLEKFWHYTNTLDKVRNENFKHISPKSWELLLGDRYNS